MKTASRIIVPCARPTITQPLIADPGSTDWVQAERLLVNFESLAQFVEGLFQRCADK